ncbi:efflux RND transporter periplasmic adaptor subunit [uncultured Chitinophaga sp.]|jgi:RND family efflux transporter, MFP subunit|uniref:efflux RND transporter periplasmic adaptor subunit n=1 Tax=uncultured Chitinophaga sp. TaxID=339340 RepID=UPI002609EB4E|nr:efflux RND transporter periplasmic adaptor subunit [uncultured Chitinophaga sp.]
MAKLITGILGAYVLVAGCKGKAETPHATPPPNPPAIVDVIVTSTTPVNNTIEASGTIVANEYAELHPEISGRITYLNVPEGTQIAKGTLIARINDADLQAQLEKSKVQLDLYQKTEERDRKLLAINGINQADYDLALNNVNSTKADIDYTQAQIDKTIIRAPFNGIIGLRQVSIGAYVSPATVIATIQQLDKIRVDFTLPEQYSNVVKKGAIADVMLDAAGNIHRKAQIIAAEPQITPTSRNLKVRAVLEDGKGRPGAFAKVYINAGADAKSILVPTNAIIPNDKNNQVILVKNGKATFTDVRTAVREANNIEITEGVNPGDTVVVTGVLFARPGAKLKVRSVKTLTQLAAEQQ